MGERGFMDKPQGRFGKKREGALEALTLSFDMDTTEGLERLSQTHPNELVRSLANRLLHIELEPTVGERTTEIPDLRNQLRQQLES